MPVLPTSSSLGTRPTGEVSRRPQMNTPIIDNSLSKVLGVLGEQFEAEQEKQRDKQENFDYMFSKNEFNKARMSALEAIDAEPDYNKHTSIMEKTLNDARNKLMSSVPESKYEAFNLETQSVIDTSLFQTKIESRKKWRIQKGIEYDGMVEDTIKGVVSGGLTEEEGLNTIKALAQNAYGIGAIDDKRLDDVERNYASSIINKKIQNNPLDALMYIERDEVKDTFSTTEYNKIKESIESRVANIDKTKQIQGVVNFMKTNNDLYNRSLSEDIPLAELQNIFERDGTPKNVQDVLLKLNGFKKETDKLPSIDERFRNKENLYSKMMVLGTKEDLDINDINDFQNDIYSALNDKTITRDEGMQWINALTEPYLEAQEERLSKYQTGKWNPFLENTGFDRIKQFYEDNIEIPDDGSGETFRVNTKNKVMLYDLYSQQLINYVNKTEGVNSLLDLEKLPRKDKEEIFSLAQRDATFLMEQEISKTLKNYKAEDVLVKIPKVKDDKKATGIYTELSDEELLRRLGE